MRHLPYLRLRSFGAVAALALALAGLAAGCGGSDPTDPDNKPPIITEMTGPERVTVGQLAVYQCFAEEPDGDLMFWSWSSGNSRNNTAALTFQNPLTIGITCTVTDGKGGSDSETITLVVVPVV